MKAWLLDTGPLVAFMDAADPNHARVCDLFDKFEGQFFTTTAVVVEAMHFAARFRSGPRKLVDFLKVSGTSAIDCCQPSDLANAVPLMAKYADRPMDFADASLVLLAESLRIYKICTVDRRGFSAFRTRNGKGFQLVLDFDLN